MKVLISAINQKYKFPQTQVYSLLNDELIVFLRSWNGNDSNQKVIDEISHYLSAANADLEITTPFEFIESLSSMGNKVRVALLLANDIIHNFDNKEIYSQGYEVAVVFRTAKEIVCGHVGRFSVQAYKNNHILELGHGGTFLDEQILLPTALLGIDSEAPVFISSIATKDLTSLEVKSSYLSDAATEQSMWQAQITEI